EGDDGGRWASRFIEEDTMRPCQEFRFWAKRAPTAERISAGVGALLVVVLLSWLLVPGSGPKSTNLASAGGGIAGEGGTGAATGGAGGTPGAGPNGGGAAVGGATAGGPNGGARTEERRGGKEGRLSGRRIRVKEERAKA